MSRATTPSLVPSAWASLMCTHHRENSIFQRGDGHSEGETALPYGLIREHFRAAGIELNTPDLNLGRPVLFELHVNARRQSPKSRAYVYLFENPLIRPLNRNHAALARYARWFTWDQTLLTDPRASSLLYPACGPVVSRAGPESRDLFLVHVASNKALLTVDPRDQYQVRALIIRWYEENAPMDFHLYGRGWEYPAALSGGWGRVCHQWRKTLGKFCAPVSPYRTWRGTIENKMMLLGRARFCIAHENCRDLAGYVTEKLFDCFRTGCVPIYVGPKEIHDLIPAACFIDGRQFANPAAMDAYLRGVNNEQYRGYQQAAQAFMQSAAAKLFRPADFATRLTDEILKDLAVAGLFR